MNEHQELTLTGEATALASLIDHALVDIDRLRRERARTKVGIRTIKARMADGTPEAFDADTLRLHQHRLAIIAGQIKRHRASIDYLERQRRAVQQMQGIREAVPSMA